MSAHHENPPKSESQMTRVGLLGGGRENIYTESEMLPL